MIVLGTLILLLASVVVPAQAPGAPPGNIAGPLLEVRCPSLASPRVATLFHLELSLHLRTLSQAKRAKVQGMRLQVECGKLHFTVKIGMGASSRHRTFYFPQSAVDMERIVALAAAEMLVTEFHGAAKPSAKSVAKPLNVAPRPGPREAGRPRPSTVKPKARPLATTRTPTPSGGRYHLLGGLALQQHSDNLVLYGASAGGGGDLSSSLRIEGMISALRGGRTYEAGEATITLITLSAVLSHRWALTPSLGLAAGCGLGISTVGLWGRPSPGNRGDSFWTIAATAIFVGGARWEKGHIALGLSAVLGYLVPQVRGLVEDEGSVSLGGPWAGLRVEVGLRF